MADKDLQKTKELNAQARANMNPDGSSKISLTQGNAGSSNNGMSSSTNDIDLEDTKKKNEQSRSNKSK